MGMPMTILSCPLLYGEKRTMKNFLALLGGLVLVLICVGWYLGWYKVKQHTHNGEGGVHISIDTGKIKEDLAKSKQKIEGLFTRKSQAGQEEAEPKSPTGVTPPEPLEGPPVPERLRRELDNTPIPPPPYPGFRELPR